MITLAAMIFVALLMAYFVSAPESGAPQDENEILALVLRESFAQLDRYTVVNPQTQLGHFPQEMEQTKQYIAKNLITNGIVVPPQLIDDLIERNKEPVRLTLKSSLKDGYLIDFDGKYAKYFEKDGGGWGKLYEENPKACGYTTVSMPVYDKETRLILVYKGTQWGLLAGRGSVFLCRYSRGELDAIGGVMLWIS